MQRRSLAIELCREASKQPASPAMSLAVNQLQHLAHEEAEKLARGGSHPGKLLDPYAFERPLERTARVRQVQISMSLSVR